MSFDPAWFLTIPGLLITGGVVLLLIALIVFIATSKKDKGASVDPTVEGSIPIVGGPDDVNNMAATQTPMGMDNNMMNGGMMPTPDMNVAAAPMGMEQTPGVVDPMNNLGNVAAQPMPTPNIPENINPAPVEMPNVNPVDMGMAAPMADAPVSIPTIESAPTINIEAPETVSNMTPGVNPTPEVAPVIDFNNVTPIATPTPEENNTRPIYGGANPLENTASIPTVSSHTAYNGEPIIPNSVVEEVKVMDVPQTAPADLGNGLDTQTATIPQEPTPVVPAAEPIAPTPITETPVAPQPVQNNNGIETLDF